MIKPKKEIQMTPRKAIQRMCVACAGSVQDLKCCGGDKLLNGQGDGKGTCHFYPHRMGKGRPSVKLIRKFCLECMGGSKQLVAECQLFDCPLHPYRFGKNPKRAGVGNKKPTPPSLGSENRSKNRIVPTN